MRKLQRRLCLGLAPIAAALFLLAGLPAAASAVESGAASPPIETVEAPSGATETSSPGWTTEGGAATPVTPPPVRQGSSVGSGGSAPPKAPSTTAPTPSPPPAPTPAPTSEAPSYTPESSSPAPETSAPAPVEEPAAAAPAASPAPAPVEKPEPAPAPAPEPVGKADLAGATALTHPSPPAAKTDSETPAAIAPLPSGDEGGSSWVTPLLIVLALCILGLATVQLRRYLRYRRIEAVKRERAVAWDAAVHQIQVQRSLGAVEPSAKGLHAVETPDRPTHLAA